MTDTELIVLLEAKRAALEAELTALAGRPVKVAVGVHNVCASGANRALAIAALRAGWKLQRAGRSRWVSSQEYSSISGVAIYDRKAPRQEAS